MTEILLIRHGESSWDAPTDMERRLTERGIAAVNAARDWLQNGQWQPDMLWASPYYRAIETAGILNRDWQLPTERKASLSPDAGFGELEAMLDATEVKRLLLVGHNPLFSNCVNRWHSAKPESYWGMQPASMALMEADVLAPGCANLCWLRHYPNYDHDGR
ncbi:MAG: SixA phosphatase family protein [Spongiibacteraceae bacterium]